MLGELKSVMAEKHIELSWDAKLLDYLVEKGYSVTYGARNLRRLIQKEVEDLIAQRIIDLRGAESGSVKLSAADGKVVVEL